MHWEHDYPHAYELSITRYTDNSDSRQISGTAESVQLSLFFLGYTNDVSSVNKLQMLVNKASQPIRIPLSFKVVENAKCKGKC